MLYAYIHTHKHTHTHTHVYICIFLFLKKRANRYSGQVAGAAAPRGTGLGFRA